MKKIDFEEEFLLAQKKRFSFTSIVLVVILFLFGLLFLGAKMYDSSLFTKAPEEPFENPFPEEEKQNAYKDEVRGIYIASVYNLNFPSASGLSVEAIKGELDDIILQCESTGFNTIYFQVRPSADALYLSNIFPSSRFFVEEEGTTLPVDPLSYLIEKASEKEMKVVAWVNPYRISTQSFETKEEALEALSEMNPAKKNPELTVFYDGKLYFDPGIPEVRELVVSGVEELCSSYEISGVLYDDYFYPYPVEGEVFPDKNSYENSKTALSLEDWRRDNVNKMVEETYRAVKSISKDLTFGVSPFGIWKNTSSDPDGSKTAGLEAYSSLYCDALAWVRGGYVDYLAPQIYWDKDNKAASFEVLSEWWNEKLMETDVELIISHGAYRVGEFEGGGEEIARQVSSARERVSFGGSIQYGYADIKNNTEGVKDALAQVFSVQIEEENQ